MSGKTSETRCKHCGGEEGHLVHHAGKGFKNAHKFEPTPPEGEAVPEQRDKCIRCGAEECGHGKCPNCDFKCRKCLKLAADAAPVVSTAAPEPPDEVCPNCQGVHAPKVVMSFVKPVAPDSYKPAEEVMPTATEDDNRSHIRRSAKEASLKTPGLAATPVTVEAPEPKWPALTTRARCVKPILGNCSSPHWLGKPTEDRKALQQIPHPHGSDCKEWAALAPTPEVAPKEEKP